MYICGILFTSIFGGVNLYRLHEDLYMENFPYNFGISPSEISPARRNFLILSCSAVVFGWIFSYIFLYLYFQFDDGFFTVADLQFEYDQTEIGEKRNENNLEESFKGEWVDLSGEEEHKEDKKVNDDSMVECNDSDFSRSIGLNESERSTFDEIKSTFRYYRK